VNVSPPAQVENAKIALIQFCVSPPKTDMENNVIVSDYTQMDRIYKVGACSCACGCAAVRLALLLRLRLCCCTCSCGQATLLSKRHTSTHGPLASQSCADLHLRSSLEQRYGYAMRQVHELWASGSTDPQTAVHCAHKQPCSPGSW
jgi:hypothetical protein